MDTRSFRASGSAGLLPAKTPPSSRHHAPEPPSGITSVHGTTNLTIVIFASSFHPASQTAVPVAPYHTHTLKPRTHNTITRHHTLTLTLTPHARARTCIQV